MPNGDFTKEGVLMVSRPVPDADMRVALRAAVQNPGGARPPVSTRPPPRRPPFPAEDALFLQHSALMRAIGEIIEQVADTDTTVLIRGESGVGKEIVARAMHDASPRRAQPFVKVNCAALPAELLESELFGHEKGAFTGAYRRKPGKFEFANNGALLLDEIGELPLALQSKLLHALQDHEFSRVGGREMIRVDARVIAVTNRDLEVALRSGQFREDLYYRLNVVEIRVPPLRERKEEIPFLVDYYLKKFNRQYGRKTTLLPEAIGYFVEYSWPGNVRELENIVRRLVVLGNVPGFQEGVLEGLRTNWGRPPEAPGAPEASPSPPLEEHAMSLRDIGRRAALEAERRAIQGVLDRNHWNRAEAARLLKTSYTTLLSRIAACGLAPKKQRPAS